MEASSAAAPNYFLIWLVYLAATAVFYYVYWRVTAFRQRIWLSYSLRALMLALVLTPWYANTQGTVLAPALMVVALDTITIGVGAMGRAMVPLTLSLLAAEILASIAWLIRKRRTKSAVKHAESPAESKG